MSRARECGCDRCVVRIRGLESFSGVIREAVLGSTIWAIAFLIVAIVARSFWVPVLAIVSGLSATLSTIIIYQALERGRRQLAEIRQDHPNHRDMRTYFPVVEIRRDDVVLETNHGVRFVVPRERVILHDGDV